MMSGGLAVLALAILSLLPGRPARGTIASGQVHTFQIAVPSQHFVHGVVDQGEHDLIVRVVSPDGRPLATYDARDRAEELVSFTAEHGGAYQITITTAAPRIRGV